MEFQSSMSAREMEVRTSTATHILDGISDQQVSNGNGGQNINSNSQTGWNFRAACQQWKSEYQQQLTYWMEFQSSMSAMEMEVRTSTATHSLDGISEQHVSNGNGGQNINSNSQSAWNFRAACQQWKWKSEHHSNSQPGWNFRAACQQWKWKSEYQQQLTRWMEFQSSMSAMEMEVRTSQQLTTWMEFQSSMSAMEMEVRTSTATHKLDGISELHVSNGNGGQNINSNSLPGWNFRAACQQWK